jgi:transcriptional regulator with XRE-family HTH domain
MLGDARRSRGMTQASAAERSGVSQSFWSRLERGASTAVSLETLAACGAAVGLQLASFYEQAPGADLPRDIQHLRRQDLVVRLATPGGWTPVPEAAVPGDGRRPRSIDVLLMRGARREAAIVEIWDLLTDGGEAMRGLEAKVLASRERLGPDWHVQGLLVLRGTQRNRRLVRDLGALFAARFPASSTAWLKALADPKTQMPSAGGLVWTDVSGTRLFAARLPLLP